MNQIKCPHCNKTFELDETGYAHLRKEVRDQEFSSELQQFKDSVYKQHESEINELKSKFETQMEAQTVEWQNRQQIEKEKYEFEIKARDNEIDRLRSYKTSLSTKAIGESLEQYCSDEFNKLRATAFQDVSFGKDNDGSQGSKGDFIYRELAEDGTELLSIMFEMKNEMDTTATKHKNEDFFKKLDKDRTTKNCEYAILVSMLEADSDLYNSGIVDVSYLYGKMYVIRPRFFIPIITILRNAALRSLDYKKEIYQLKNQQVDLIQFEKNLSKYQDTVSSKLNSSANKYNDAIGKLTAAIDELTKVRDALVDSQDYLGEANEVANKITFKKLTKNAPGIKAQLDELGICD